MIPGINAYSAHVSGTHLQCVLTPCNIRLEMVQRLCGVRRVEKVCVFESFLLHVSPLDL